LTVARAAVSSHRGGRGSVAANLGFLFTETAFLDRFAAARRAGFTAVEFPWPSAPADAVVAAAADAGVKVTQLNMAAGDLSAGERGWPNDPTRRVQWREAFAKGLALAARLDCPVVNVLAGNRVADCGLGEQRACLRDNLAWALPFARRQGRVLLLEVLNDRDTPRYLLTHLDDAADLVRRAGSPALRLQFDSYHVGRLCGPESVPQRFAAVATLVGHVQVADVPGRHEPGTGQIDFAAFFAELRRAGYRGAVAAEYVPTAGTTAGLGWLDRPWW